MCALPRAPTGQASIGHYSAVFQRKRPYLLRRFLPVAFKVRVSEDVVVSAGCVDAGKKTRKALRPVGLITF